MPNDRPLRVLLLEDDPVDAEIAQWCLEGEVGLVRFEVTWVATLTEALRQLSSITFDIVILDLFVTDARGLEVLTRVTEVDRDLPILILSGLQDERLALEAVLKGAQDYLIKDEINGRQLRRTIRHAIERKRVECRLEHMARHDALTGLPNRAQFQFRLAEALRRACHKQQFVAVILLDLDGFKPVNDRYGHAEGDKVLRQVADRLRRALRRSDLVARLGGDEFTFILEGLCDPDDAASVASKIIEALAPPFECADRAVTLGASLGIALSRGDMTPETMVEQADMAMYDAKLEGESSFRFFDPASSALRLSA